MRWWFRKLYLRVWSCMKLSTGIALNSNENYYIPWQVGTLNPYMWLHYNKLTRQMQASVGQAWAHLYVEGKETKSRMLSEATIFIHHQMWPKSKWWLKNKVSQSSYTCTCMQQLQPRSLNSPAISHVPQLYTYAFVGLALPVPSLL